METFHTHKTKKWKEFEDKSTDLSAAVVDESKERIKRTSKIKEESSIFTSSLMPLKAVANRTQNGTTPQMKMLMFFLLRGIKAGYAFQLRDQLELVGHLVFKYQVTQEENWRFRFLQTKYRKCEGKSNIQASQLLEERGDFNLEKYSSDYCRMIDNDEDVHDFIICTNGTFDLDDFTKHSIELVGLPVDYHDDILVFENNLTNKTRSPACYRIKATDFMRKKMKNLSEIQVNNFFEKLIFVVDAPNEDELDTILKREMGSLYSLIESDLQSMFILYGLLHTILPSEKVHRNYIQNDAFQMKLLLLLLCQGMSSGYQGELVSDSDNFCNLLLKHQVNDCPSYNYRYLSITQKQEKSATVQVIQLFGDKNSPYYLQKHFRSYCTMTAMGRHIEDFVICTNIGFNKRSFQKAKIDLFPLDEKYDILAFQQTSTQKLKGVKKWVKKPSRFKCKIAVDWRQRLVKEWLVNRQKMKPEIDSLRVNATESDIDNFFDKLVFIADIPDDRELDHNIIGEVDNYYSLSSFVTNTLRACYGKEEKHTFLSSEEGWRIFNQEDPHMISLRATDVSLNYVKHLNDVLTFNPVVIQDIAEKLKPFISLQSDMDDERFQVRYVTTPSPSFTTIKLVAALKHEKYLADAKQDFQRHGSYLVTSSTYLQKSNERQWIRKAILNGDFQNLLVVVCDPDTPFKIIKANSQEDELEKGRDKTMVYLFSPEEIQFITHQKKIIVVLNENTTDYPVLFEDTIKYDQLDEKSKDNILNTKISFQGSEKTVRELTDGNSIAQIEPTHFVPILEELVLKRKQVVIPSCSFTPPFEKAFYIGRRMQLKISHDFIEILAKKLKTSSEQLVEQCRIMPNGLVEWFVEEDRKLEILNAMRKLMNRTDGINKWISDFELIGQNWTGRVVILSGKTKTGKSTVLTHFSEKIKEERPDYWILRINLISHIKFLAIESNLTSVDDFIPYFVNLLTSDVKNSPFALWLLKHRLLTSGGVVLMFDEFGEIQDKVAITNAINLMKAISQTKLERLYVTAQPYESTDQLQDAFFQLGYKLDCLSEEKSFETDSQISILTSFWTSQLEVINTGQLIDFARKLIEKTMKTLMDNERAIFTIPLQVTILAECFKREIANYLKYAEDEKQFSHVSEKLESILKSTKFGLSNLYCQLMEAKRLDFRKKKFDSLSSVLAQQIVDLATDRMLINTEIYLKRLAIETVFKKKEIVDLLWPPEPSFDSIATRRDKENNNIENAILFGLVFKNKENASLQFLHRTYAEYLVAEYLCQGFEKDDEKHNKLLDNESVRKFIAKEIFTEYEYKSVCIFLDSMLKEIINSDEWKWFTSKPHLGDRLPERLKKIAVDVRDGRSGYIRAIQTKNSNLFVFLFDCLQAKQNQSEIQHIVESAFNDPFWFDLCYHQSSLVFERLIRYYDNTSKEKVKFILDKMLRNDRIRYCVEWKHNQTEREKILKHLFDFMDRANANGTLNAFLDPKTNFANHNDADLLRILTCKDGYEDRLKQFLDLYLSVYPLKDKVLAELLTSLFKQYEDYRSVNDQTVKERCTLSLLNGKIQKILFILKDHGRNEVSKRISRFVLKRDLLSFQDFYKPKEPEKEEDALVSENMESLMNRRDSAGMTRLHRAVYHGHTETVDQILKWIVDVNKTDPKAKNCLAQDDAALTPFYVAYARGHREIGTKILECIKEVFSKKELKEHMTVENGFLHIALLETFIFDETDMMEWIFTEIKRIFGSDLLDCVLQSDNCERYYRSFDRPREKFIEVIANLVTDQHNKKEMYKKVSDLVFLDAYLAKKMLQCTAKDKTLEKMIEVEGGIRIWIKRFFTINEGFRCLNDVIESQIIELNDDVRKQLIESGKSTLEKLESNWKKRHFFSVCIEVRDLLECIQRNVGEEALREVLLHNDGECIARIILSNYDYGRVAEKILRLSNIDELSRRIIHHALAIIPEMYSNFRYRDEASFMNILLIMKECASKDQLMQFVDIILVEKAEKSEFRSSSIWHDYLLNDLDFRRHDNYHTMRRMSSIDPETVFFVKQFKESEYLFEVVIFLELVSEKLGQNIMERLVNEGLSVASNKKEENGLLEFFHGFKTIKLSSYSFKETKNSSDIAKGTKKRHRLFKDTRLRPELWEYVEQYQLKKTSSLAKPYK